MIKSMSSKSLKDGTSWEKATYYKGGNLKGVWLATYKIDGCRLIRGKDNKVYSRDSKESVHDLSKFKFKDAEFFFKDWSTSTSILRTKEETTPITQDMFYELTQGQEDPRLIIGRVVDPTEETIQALLTRALSNGYEGVVLRFLGSKPKWIKVVPVRYADIRINKIIEGNGKLKGMVGTIETDWGDVGSFKQDYQFRKWLWEHRKEYIGKIIQVSYREVSKENKLRFPVLVRIRDDKDYEDVEL